ncbi:MAG: MFS transporter [Chloroflexi bacterium]|nr:MFS transporter [Chloroflexota bacterium]
MPIFDSTTMAHKPGLRARIGNMLTRIWSVVAPDPVAWHGAGLGLALLTLVLLVLSFMTISARLPLPGIILTLAGVLLGLLVSDVIVPLLVRLFRVIPPAYRRWLLWSVTIILLLLNPFIAGGMVGLWILLTWAILTGSLIGGGVAVLVSRRFGALTRVKKAIMLVGLAVGAGLLVLGGVWVLGDGTTDVSPPNAAAVPAGVPLLDLPDPSLVGPYAVLTLTYGSGSDIQRPEYGAAADILTEPVNGAALVGNWSGLSGNIRTAFWGFDATALPINGRVWYPNGAGPFPLFLIVHGNHDMTEFSDPGYAYLGEHLASQGYIVASVDENFLNTNGGVDFILGGLSEENDLRGWLLLEHLKRWREWNAMPDSPFYQKIDLGRIAIGGHSRGGEAALVAASFNNLPNYPGNANITFDYGFAIQGVIAIAPIDGQYSPMNQPTPLENVNYLVIHGGYDGDVDSFDGVDVYDRVKFDAGDRFKAAVWIAGANHGQFNTVWGRSDRSDFGARVLNTAPIMAGDAQRQAARVFSTAFLNATLKDEPDYRALFRDPRVGTTWLPDGIYLTQYADSRTTFVSSYGEDINVTTATLPGGTLNGENLTIWREQKIDSKWGLRATSAVYLGWDRTVNSGLPVYKVTLPPDGLREDDRSVLVMALAQSTESANPDGLTPKAASAVLPGPESETVGLDFTIVLIDQAGQSARLPLIAFSAVQPQINVQLYKTPFGDLSSEPILQHFEFPMASFMAANPGFDPTTLEAIWLLFDRTPSGVVIVDDIGFRHEYPGSFVFDS